MNYQQLKQSLEADPSASYFIKDMMYEADRRDAVDVINDCEAIICIMKARISDNKAQQRTTAMFERANIYYGSMATPMKDIPIEGTAHK